MCLLKRISAVFLAVWFSLQGIILFSVAEIPATEDYELYDFLSDVNNCRKSGLPVASNSPWSVQLKPCGCDWEDSVNTYVYGNNDGYIYAYNSDHAWGVYPGYSFYYPDNYDAERLYLNVIAPTNSAYDDSWSVDVAYTFTPKKEGVYSLHPADQSKVYSFADCNCFHQWNRDEDLDFGVRITVNNVPIWPKTGEIRNGFGVFGTADAAISSIEVPTINNLILGTDDIVRVEFTNFTPATVAWAQRICGSVAMSRMGSAEYGIIQKHYWNSSELYLHTSEGLKPIESGTELNGDGSESIITNSDNTFGRNYSIAFSVDALSGFGNGLHFQMAQFDIILTDQGGEIYSESSGFYGSFGLKPIGESKYDIKLCLQEILFEQKTLGSLITISVNNEEYLFRISEVSDSGKQDFTINNSQSGITLNLTGYPVSFRSDSGIVLDRRTNVVYLPDGTDEQVLENALIEKDGVILPDILQTNGVIESANSIERFYIALQYDVNGDSRIDIRDLLRAKKAAAGIVEVTTAQIFAITEAHSYEITANALSDLRKRLLREKAGEQSLPIYKKAIIPDLSENLISSWSKYGLGYETSVQSNPFRKQEIVFKMQNTERGMGCGMEAVIQEPPTGTYILSAYSKAVNVTRTEDTEYYSYSLVASVEYKDGTSKDFCTLFSYGTHDWEYRETSFPLSKEAKKITVYVFFRTPALGTAYFDAIRFVRGNKETLTFHDIPVTPVQYNCDSATKAVFNTEDGLKLKVSDNRVTQVTVDGIDITSDTPSGFLANDIGNSSDQGIFGFDGRISSDGKYTGEQKELGLYVEAYFKAKSSCISVSGTLKDLKKSSEGRSVKLSYALPVSSVGCRWATDILKSVAMKSDTPGCVYKSYGDGYMSVVDWDSEKRSYFPTAALYNEKFGIAISAGMDFPQYYEIEYNATTQSYVITLQLGLTDQAPDSARFDFSIYKLDEPTWGFRSAMSKYTRIHPEYYQTREKNHGLWLAWADVSNVSGLEDFNLKFKEIDQDFRATGSFETLHGIKGYHYLELGDWWISDLRSNDTQDVWNRINELAKGDKKDRSTLQAIATEFCYTETINGELTHNPVNNPWCRNGAQIHVNANPLLPGKYNFFNLWYNDTLKEIWFNRQKMTGTATFDGIYLDELSGWWLGNANFNRRHYGFTTVPLTYSPYEKKPMLHRASTTWECVKAISDDLHANNRTVFANKCPDKNAFYTPLVDAMGTEQTALSDTVYQPQSIEMLSTWRTLAYSKPFCILLSNDYDVFDHEMMEKYFCRCLAYAIFPSPCANYADGEQYFTSLKKYYERDRDIFVRYMPIMKHISEIGWEAVTGATVSDSSVIVERYGSVSSDGEIYFTLYNPTGQNRTVTLNLNLNLLGLEENCYVSEALFGETVSHSDNQYTVSIPSEKILVLRFVN